MQALMVGKPVWPKYPLMVQRLKGKLGKSYKITCTKNEHTSANSSGKKPLINQMENGPELTILFLASPPTLGASPALALASTPETGEKL